MKYSVAHNIHASGAVHCAYFWNDWTTIKCFMEYEFLWNFSFAGICCISYAPWVCDVPCEVMLDDEFMRENLISDDRIRARWSLTNARLPWSRKTWESQGIRKLCSRPLKVREFHTFYSKSGKSLWILYHLGSIRMNMVTIPTSVLHICFPILTVCSHCFCWPIFHGRNLTGSHYGLSSKITMVPV